METHPQLIYDKARGSAAALRHSQALRPERGKSLASHQTGGLARMTNYSHPTRFGNEASQSRHTANPMGYSSYYPDIPRMDDIGTRKFLLLGRICNNLIFPSSEICTCIAREYGYATHAYYICVHAEYGSQVSQFVLYTVAITGKHLISN